jgi:glutamyl-tRNA synthetase
MKVTNMTKEIITRFAPSPTGFLHIGGARTALFNWVYAQKMGGKMLLRIEDTDRARSTTEAVDAILDGLSWLGLNWSGDPISQFANKERHAQVANQLVQSGHAYKCYCSPEELAQMREEAKKAGASPHYNGYWRDKNPSEAPKGVEPVIRIKTPISQTITIKDHVQGDVVYKSENLDDFIILRSDGTPTYMLAVVVDDHDMGVTHIIRGDDHLTNAARQVIIYNALNWEVPQMAHIPLIHGADGAKLSKRHGALGVDVYRKQGYLPEAVRNYLARLGWSHGDDEIFSTKQMIEWFDLDALNKGASRFDFVKLANINGQYIKEAKVEYLYSLMLDLAKELNIQSDILGLSEHKVSVIAALPQLQSRAKTVVELIDLAQFIYAKRPLEIEEKALTQLNDENCKIIALMLTDLEHIEDWSLEIIKDCVKAFAEDQELKLGKVAQPLRAALTGRSVSPSVFDVMALIGKEESLARLKDQIKTP